jgi:hypothetical protein
MPLIPNKLGWARNETQSEIIEIKDLKYKKSMIIIVVMILIVVTMRIMTMIMMMITYRVHGEKKNLDKNEV